MVASVLRKILQNLRCMLIPRQSLLGDLKQETVVQRCPRKRQSLECLRTFPTCRGMGMDMLE